MICVTEKRTISGAGRVLEEGYFGTIGDRKLVAKGRGAER